MSRRFIITVVVVLLTLALVGGAIAATPYLQRGGGFRMGGMLGGMASRVANFLGIELQQVIDSRAAGDTFADILGEDLDEFVAATVAERQTIIDELVREGKITQAQAELCANFSAERLQERLQSEFAGCGAGGQFRAGANRFMQNMRGRIQRTR